MQQHPYYYNNNNLRRYVEDEGGSTVNLYHDYDTDDYHTTTNSDSTLLINCSQYVHNEFISFLYVLLSIVWYISLVSLLHRFCLKYALDGAPIYDTQYWFITATILYALLVIAITMFLPQSCNIINERIIQQSQFRDINCIQHCQQDRIICLGCIILFSIIGLYWYYMSYVRYLILQQLSSFTTRNDGNNNNNNGTFINDSYNNGIFTKLPDNDYDTNNGLEMTEYSEDDDDDDDDEINDEVNER